MKIENYLSVLDTERFGFKVAKVELFNENLEQLMSFLKNNDVKLILCKIPFENLELINNLEDIGFRIKDIQVTYRFDLNKSEIPDFKDIDNLVIRDFIDSDISSLLEIASSSFQNYGHYANDEKLDKTKCNHIYIDWINRSCYDRTVADKVFVAEYNSEVAGFLSFKTNHIDGQSFAAGGIGAVSAKYRSKSIFKALTHMGITWGKSFGLDWEEHNVLIENYPVNRSFINYGFYPYKSFVSMHNWL